MRISVVFSASIQITEHVETQTSDRHIHCKHDTVRLVTPQGSNGGKITNTQVTISECQVQ